jgi:hypothetical protein
MTKPAETPEPTEHQVEEIVRLLHEAAGRDRAPARLRAAIEASRPSARTQTRRRIGYGGALAAGLAALALALVLVLPAGTPGGPSLSQAASLGALAPSAPPPLPDSSAPQVKLGRNIQEVYFPNWESRFGWRAIGQRTDRIDGRQAVTVYYGWHQKEIAYTIVAAPPLSTPAAQTTMVNGTLLHTLTLTGRLIVTWRRAGHTCVLSGIGVNAGVLQKLAAWRVPGESR